MIRHVIALTILSVAAFAAEAPLLSFVHPEAKILAGIQVERALASPLGRYLLAQIDEDNKGFRTFMEDTGVDPRRDVREILLVASDTQRKHGLAVARGVFNGPRIISAAEKHGAAVSTYNGIQVAAAKSGGQLIAILDGAIALAGDETLVKYAIDHRSDTAVPSFALAQRAANLSGQYDAWTVGSGAITPPHLGRGPQMPAAAMFQNIRETSAGLELGSIVRLSAEALTRSDKDAQALVDVIRFMATMIRNNDTNNPDAQRFQSILDSLEVRAEAATVKLSVAVPESDLEQWIKPKRRTRRAVAFAQPETR